jgi:hypothetical protein
VYGCQRGGRAVGLAGSGGVQQPQRPDLVLNVQLAHALVEHLDQCRSLGGLPFNARTCEASIAHRSRSSGR